MNKIICKIYVHEKFFNFVFSFNYSINNKQLKAINKKFLKVWILYACHIDKYCRASLELYDASAPVLFEDLILDIDFIEFDKILSIWCKEYYKRLQTYLNFALKKHIRTRYLKFIDEFFKDDNFEPQLLKKWSDDRNCCDLCDDKKIEFIKLHFKAKAYKKASIRQLEGNPKAFLNRKRLRESDCEIFGALHVLISLWLQKATSYISTTQQLNNYLTEELWLQEDN